MAAYSWLPLTASVLAAVTAPAATLVMVLPPLSRPAVVRLTALPLVGVMVTPLPLVTVVPVALLVVTLVNTGVVDIWMSMALALTTVLMFASL